MNSRICWDKWQLPRTCVVRNGVFSQRKLYGSLAENEFTIAGHFSSIRSRMNAASLMAWSTKNCFAMLGLYGSNSKSFRAESIVAANRMACFRHSVIKNLRRLIWNVSGGRSLYITTEEIGETSHEPSIREFAQAVLPTLGQIQALFGHRKLDGVA